MSVRIHAFGDFLRRYATIFARVWAIRATLDRPRRPAHELMFLPASVELADTPVHPAPQWAMRTVVVGTLIVLALALVGRLDIVVTAKGKLVPDARVKVIQPATGGVVRRIDVTDGQRVAAGALLVELDPTQARADADDAREQRLDFALAMARERAVLDALDAGTSPVVVPPAGASAADVDAAQRYAEGLLREYEDKRAAAEGELAKDRAELAADEDDLTRLAAAAPLARRQADDYRALVAQKFVSQVDYLEKEQAALQAEREAAEKAGSAAELRAGIQGQSAQIAALTSEFRRERFDALTDATTKYQQAVNAQTKATTRQGMTRLYAPVAGTVQQLAVHTLGGVVTTAQALMEIVPDDTLEVDAAIENKDVGFVHTGQSAVVKIDAFPYTEYGYLHGTVAFVSNDAVDDKKDGLTFVAHITLPTNRVQISGQSFRLTPGMTVSAEIKTGSRSVAAYFLNPLVQTAQESMRER